MRKKLAYTNEGFRLRDPDLKLLPINSADKPPSVCLILKIFWKTSPTFLTSSFP